MIKKGTWVKIEKVLLKPQQRASHLPEETKKVPYIMHICGYLVEDANLGEEVTIKTKICRTHKGKLIEVNPSFKHNFGTTIPELIDINISLRKELQELGEKNG